MPRVQLDHFAGYRHDCADVVLLRLDIDYRVGVVGVFRDRQRAQLGCHLHAVTVHRGVAVGLGESHIAEIVIALAGYVARGHIDKAIRRADRRRRRLRRRLSRAGTRHQRRRQKQRPQWRNNGYLQPYSRLLSGIDPTRLSSSGRRANRMSIETKAASRGSFTARLSNNPPDRSAAWRRTRTACSR